MAKHKDPATEQKQVVIVWFLSFIAVALAGGNIQLLSITREMGEMRSEISALGNGQFKVEQRVERLERYHFGGRPKPEPVLMPPVEVIPSDRRKLHSKALKHD